MGPDAAPIEPGYQWQPMLWRAVRERAGTPSLPELLPAGLDPIRSGEIELDLPARLSVYGLTAMDPLDLEVFMALGEHRDVHLYVLHPSPALWELTSGRTPPPGIVGRDDDTTRDLAAHPLLKVWGRDSRELQTVLIERGLHGSLVGEGDERSDTLLGRLRADIAANRTPELDSSVATAVTAAADRSVQLHVCHGDRRQAEVLRDAVLHVLAADPSLEARDIVIMTPDLGTFAPLLEAAFPSAEATLTNGLPDLRLRIADRAPAATNPLVRFTATLLALADGRLEAGVVRELVTRPVVQQRFGFDNETAGELIGLLDDATIAWGLDSTERDAWGAGTNDERTWSRGLDRMLTGVFYGDDTVRVIGRTAPMLGIEGQEAATAGLVASLLDRLVAVRSMLSAGRPMSKWASTISGAIRLLAAPGVGRGLAARPARTAPGRHVPRTRGRQRRRRDHACRGPPRHRFLDRRPTEPSAFSHRRRDRVHARPHAFGALQGRVPARHGRGPLPPREPPGWRRPAAASRNRGRPQPQRRGPPAPSRCGDGG